MSYATEQASLTARLSNLTPATVRQIQDAPWVTKALAMPGVIEAGTSITDVPFINDRADEEIDVKSEMNISPDSEERMVVMDKFVIVGGLAYDSDCENPLESCEGEGRIVHHRNMRYGQKDDHAAFCDALGITEDGDRRLDATPVCEKLGDLVWAKVRTSRRLVASLSYQVRKHNRAKNLEFAVREAASYGGSAEDVASAFTGRYAWHALDEAHQQRLQPLVDLFEETQDAAYEAAIDAGTFGEPLAVMLDVYEHGGSSYTVSGEGMNCRWDTSRGGAMWIPCQIAKEYIRDSALEKLGIGALRQVTANDQTHWQYKRAGNAWKGHYPDAAQALAALLKPYPPAAHQAFLRAMQTEARDYARGVAKEYTAWANGDCHGVVCYVIDRETGERIEDRGEECWGFVSSEYAEEELESSMLYLIERLGATVQ